MQLVRSRTLISWQCRVMLAAGKLGDSWCAYHSHPAYIQPAPVPASIAVPGDVWPLISGYLSAHDWIQPAQQRQACAFSMVNRGSVHMLDQSIMMVDS
jgi:hypothetical protein